jgi:hypothetical protein
MCNSILDMLFIDNGNFEVCQKKNHFSSVLDTSPRQGAFDGTGCPKDRLHS